MREEDVPEGFELRATDFICGIQTIDYLTCDFRIRGLGRDDVGMTAHDVWEILDGPQFPDITVVAVVVWFETAEVAVYGKADFEKYIYGPTGCVQPSG